MAEEEPGYVSAAAAPLVSAPSKECGECSSPITRTPLGAYIKETLMWRNLVRSAISFAALNAVFLLVLRGGFSFLTLTCYGLLIALAASAAYVLGTMGYQHYVQKKPMENPLAGKKFTLPRESFVELGGMVGDLLNAVLLVALDVVFLRSMAVTAEVALVLLFLSWLGKKVRLTMLAYIVCIVSFMWPRLYHEQHVVIDKYAGIAYKYIVEYVQRGIALAKEKAPAKIGPLKIKNA